MAEDKNLDKELDITQEKTEQSADKTLSSATAQPSGDVKTHDEAPKTEEVSVSAENTQDMITVRPIKFQEFEMTEPIRSIKRNLDIMQDVSMHVSVELGKSKSSIKEVMDMEAGSIVELDKIAGEQVEVYVNNKLVAKGEVIVIEDKFGVRVTSTNLPKSII